MCHCWSWSLFRVFTQPMSILPIPQWSRKLSPPLYFSGQFQQLLTTSHQRAQEPHWSHNHTATSTIQSPNFEFWIFPPHQVRSFVQLWPRRDHNQDFNRTVAIQQHRLWSGDQAMSVGRLFPKPGLETQCKVWWPPFTRELQCILNKDHLRYGQSSM